MHIFNDTLLNSSNNQKVSILCHDSVVSPKLSKDKQEEAIKRLPTDPNKTANLHCSLDIIEGMLYDLTVNTNTEDGLANGASCVVKFIEHKLKETQRPSIIWVQFMDLKEGCETRLKYKNRGFYHGQINENWTPIFDIARTFTYNKKTFERIQFPLEPSAGRSVHRAQGTTLDCVVIDLSQRRTRKVPHLHYVVLSRVRSLEKLQILNFNEQALQVDEQDDVVIKSAGSISCQNFKFVLLNVARELSEMQVVILYKSPKMSDSAFRTMLTEKLFPRLVHHKPLIILGDFNIDVLKCHGGVLQYLYDKLNCRLHLNEPTTDYLSALDLIITNIDAIVGTVETYWSDHKIVYCCSQRISSN
ncbi:hypothetical protein MAR_030046 [Mya arenaria]|uniref:Endonuclease/exonuclease/phosphatase domain-containing protein n=1 Tax=Mya arenaria TaxID=6604 RepID=A0ABY7DL82_MYAAR|nr:hypothetical protein MAR_030046 [Mya arenaria]